MYCPNVLAGPLVPAPYLMMLKPPVVLSAAFPDLVEADMRTEDESHDQANSYFSMSGNVLDEWSRRQAYSPPA